MNTKDIHEYFLTQILPQFAIATEQLEWKENFEKEGPAYAFLFETPEGRFALSGATTLAVTRVVLLHPPILKTGVSRLLTLF